MTCAKKIKAKILDLAIRGKLVPQDASDEPAAKLLERIKAEKVKLVKEGKGKKEKPLPEIVADEIPFAIPASWMWVRLGDVLQPMETKYPSGKEFRYIDIDAIDNKKNVVNNPKSIPVSKAPSRASRGLKTGDTLFSVVRPYLRNIAYIDDSLSDCIASTGFYVIRPIEVDTRFMFWMLISDFAVNGLNAFMKGDNSPSIRVDQIHEFLIPLPPLAEQKRIVAKIEELRAMLKTLQK